MGMWRRISYCAPTVEPTTTNVSKSFVENIVNDILASKNKSKPNNPNPKNFKISRTNSFGNWIVAEVIYPDATNYEGKKIMVYYATIKELTSAKYLDPHFCEHQEHLSPFARFEPTSEGWSMAIELAKLLNSK